MKLVCNRCDHEFDGWIAKGKGPWVAICPECGEIFPVDIREKRIVMMFTDADDDHPNERYRYFTDNPNTLYIWHYFAYDTPEEFIEAWKEISKTPHGMWYWVIDNGQCFCSGACDPDDIEIFKEHFGKEVV